MKKRAICTIAILLAYNIACAAEEAVFVDGDGFHLFVPHRWKRALHLTLKADHIERLPTKEELKAAARLKKPLLLEAGENNLSCSMEILR